MRQKKKGPLRYHVAENMLCVGQDLVRGFALDVDNETDAARVLLVLGVVQTLGHGQHACPGSVLFIDGKVVWLLMEVVFSEGWVFDVRGHGVHKTERNKNLFF